MGFSVKD
jgi:hypothetical protein